MKDCMFQYATDHKIIADTGLITQSEALELFNNSKEDYFKRLENGESPEMAIWILCNTNESYGDTLHHWCSGDLKVIDGEVWKRI